MKKKIILFKNNKFKKLNKNKKNSINKKFPIIKLGKFNFYKFKNNQNHKFYKIKDKNKLYKKRQKIIKLKLYRKINNMKK